MNDLTPREWQVARLIATGLTNKEIATVLCISIRTVESHRTAIREKLHIRSRAEITAWYSGQMKSIFEEKVTDEIEQATPLPTPANIVAVITITPNVADTFGDIVV